VIRDQVASQALKKNHRLLRVLAAIVSVAVLLGCAERVHANIGVWGVFVWWAVAGIVALVWPLAFLVTGFGATARQRRAVHAAAFALTISSIGLLQIGWGLVMLLRPEYAIGWYIPARGGGTEIHDAADAVGTGRTMVAIGTLIVLVLTAATAALAKQTSDTADLDRSKPEAETASVPFQQGAAALVLWCCGGVFWLITLGIGLISVIQYDGVRQKLADCAPGSGSCSTDTWVANELPWILATASAVAMLPVIAAIMMRGSLPRIVSTWDDPDPALMLVTGWVYQAGSVVAMASAILYARWSDATCTGRGSLRSCGAADPDFSFAGQWLPWVTVWALTTYAVLAYLVVFSLLATTRSALAACTTDKRAKAGPDIDRSSGSSAFHVVTYLAGLVVLIGVGWLAVSLLQRASTPPETAGSWEEYVAENMNSSAYPHLEKVRLEVPTGHRPDSPLLVQVSLGGDEPEMPSAEAVSLIDAACAYQPSRWRVRTPETWVNVSYGTDGDSSRYARLGCETNHRRALTDLLGWVEQHPANRAVDEISIKSRDDGVLETQLYLPNSSTTSFQKALDYLCALPAPRGVQRSGTIFDSLADRSVSDIDCTAPDEAVAEWRRRD
jgi:hypothetical protein